MRLDKLTIGSVKDSPTHQFKNLKNVTIDFDQDHWVTVVIGWNGTGKSNVLEALAIIFRDLIAKKRIPGFAFQLAYRMGRARICGTFTLMPIPIVRKILSPFTLRRMRKPVVKAF